MKEIWLDFKRKFIPYTIMLTIGFGLGKVYTWDAIITDCKVLGAFRIAKTVTQCKVMAP